MNKQEILDELDWILNYETPIVKITDASNNIFIKKEDAIPFSFGGNKCRIAANYFKQIVNNDCDVVVTYGASSSNLCRIIANMSCRYGLKCLIVSPEENYCITPNSEMVRLLGATIVKCPIDEVSMTIDRVMSQYRIDNNPYFIYGGGHGVLGTDSYRVVMRQIAEYEHHSGISFDNIFITLATGTSMSGLVIENEIQKYGKKIIGVSVAREENRAKQVMLQALETYDANIANSISSESYEIIGDYRCGGYGDFNKDILDLVKYEFACNGLNLDTTYTGKAFFGMKEILKQRDVKGKNILFIHTGGTPLFFKESCQYLNN